MLDDLKAWESDPPQGAPKLVVVSRGTVEANHALGLRSPIVLDRGFTTTRAFGITGTPSAVLVDAQGNIASPVAISAPAIRPLIGRPASRSAAPGNGAGMAPTSPSTPKLGDPAPPIKLPDLSRRTVDLADFRGSPTLVLFWNPGCGFCKRMLDDLRAWEADRPKGAPKFLVVSTGDARTNCAMGLRSPIVLDQGFAVGGAFGASGTPSAVLVDAQGKIASDLAVGAPAVLALAKGEAPTPAGAPFPGAPAPAPPTVGDPAPPARA